MHLIRARSLSFRDYSFFDTDFVYAIKLFSLRYGCNFPRRVSLWKEMTFEEVKFFYY